jgi:hypothetical protein
VLLLLLLLLLLLQCDPNSWMNGFNARVESNQVCKLLSLPPQFRACLLSELIDVVNITLAAPLCCLSVAAAEVTAFCSAHGTSINTC